MTTTRTFGTDRTKTKVRAPLFVVVSGNPFDGLQITGPFTDGNDANDYADSHLYDDTYWILTCAAPKVDA